jgi:tetratricopeptide (TPR) repeat protein
MLSLKQGHFQDAVIFYMRAYDVSSSAGDAEGILEALDSMSDAYRKSGNEKKAEEIMKKKADMGKEKKK